MIDISIVIVDYWKGRDVKNQVLSLLKQKTKYKYEVIVIDNSCSKLNSKFYKKIKNLKPVSIYLNKKNEGYTKHIICIQANLKENIYYSLIRIFYG